MPTLTPATALKKAKALDVLQSSERWLIALSGGVDSAVLLALTAEAVGAARVEAATAVSRAVPDKDVAAARMIAEQLGVAHRTVRTDELARPDYRANRGDRCFHCRVELFDRLRPLLGSAGAGRRIAYGAIVDDLGDDRPGMRAAAQAEVAAPLIEAEIGKSEVREIARDYGLAVAERPANACLASRIPVGIEVTPERLDRVGRAEAALEALGLSAFRVRFHGELARIEVSDPEALLGQVELDRVVAAVRQAGFRFVTLDLEGYRPGGRPTRPGGQ